MVFGKSAHQLDSGHQSDAATSSGPVTQFRNVRSPEVTTSPDDALVSQINRYLYTHCKRRHPETSESSSQDSSSDNEDVTPRGRYPISPRSISRLNNRGSKLQMDKVAVGSGTRQGAAPGGSGAHQVAAMGGSSTDQMSAPGGGGAHQMAAPGGSGTYQGTAAVGSVHQVAAPAGCATHQMAATSGCFSAEVGGSSRCSRVHSPRVGLPSVRPNAMKNRQKQLEALKKYEDKIKGQMNKMAAFQASGSAGSGSKPSGLAGGGAGVAGPSQRETPVQHPMYLYTLDISNALTQGEVDWLPLSAYNIDSAPEETIFYSLTEGRGELIMFGGIQTDLVYMQRSRRTSPAIVRKEIFFLRAPDVLR